jgi:hypothetical protein
MLGSLARTPCGFALFTASARARQNVSNSANRASLVRVAALEMHPLDGISRAVLLKNELGFDALLKQVRRIQGAGSVRK